MTGEVMKINEEQTENTLAILTVLPIYVAALSYKLEIPHMVTIDQAAKIFNGVGAEWMPDEMRKFLDKASGALLPAVLVHDLDYAFGDGTMLDFQLANRRLEANGRKCADTLYGWWHYKRYVIRAQARAYAKLCDAFGFPAYAAAIEETKQHKENT
jgi:hypothetical protein